MVGDFGDFIGRRAVRLFEKHADASAEFVLLLDYAEDALNDQPPAPLRDKQLKIVDALAALELKRSKLLERALAIAT